MTTFATAATRPRPVYIQASVPPSRINDTPAGVVVQWRLRGSSQAAVSLINAEGRVRIHADNAGLVCSEAVELGLLVLSATTVAAEGILDTVTYRAKVRYEDDWLAEPAGCETPDRYSIEKFLTIHQSADEAIVEYRRWTHLDEPPEWHQLCIALPQIVNADTLRTPVQLPHNLSYDTTANGDNHAQ